MRLFVGSNTAGNAMLVYVVPSLGHPPASSTPMHLCFRVVVHSALSANLWSVTLALHPHRIVVSDARKPHPRLRNNHKGGEKSFTLRAVGSRGRTLYRWWKSAGWICCGYLLSIQCSWASRSDCQVATSHPLRSNSWHLTYYVAIAPEARWSTVSRC